MALQLNKAEKTFRDIKRKPGETYSQLGCHLDRALSRWVEGSKVDMFEA